MAGYVVTSSMYALVWPFNSARDQRPEQQQVLTIVSCAPHNDFANAIGKHCVGPLYPFQVVFVVLICGIGCVGYNVSNVQRLAANDVVRLTRWHVHGE